MRIFMAMLNLLILMSTALCIVALDTKSKKHVPLDDYITLIHGTVNRTIKKTAPDPYPDFLDPSVTILTSNKPPKGRFMPTIGNGHVATVVHSDTIYANALYNGHKGHSHRARIPSSCSISIANVSSAARAVDYSLDIGRGVYTELHGSEDFSIELKMYAHQVLNRLLVTEITVSNADSQPLVVELSENLGNESEDIDFTTRFKDGLRISEGYAKALEYNTSRRVLASVMASDVPGTIAVPAGKTYRYLFLTSIDYNSISTSEYFKTGVNQFINGTLEKSHMLAWEDIWRTGRIDMEGNRTINQINYASLYYILSGIPKFEKGETFVGLSPGDLAHGGLNMDYQGHVFWDQETWMFPPILCLHADKGKTLIKTRVRTHAAAKEYALSRGFQGSMFTWESAYTGAQGVAIPIHEMNGLNVTFKGSFHPLTRCIKSPVHKAIRVNRVHNTSSRLDVCPCDVYSAYEQHITGDVAFAIKQYVMMTNDTDFLRYEGGADLINDIALFWASRVEYNDNTKQYYINNVMPPDEYHFPVNNSIYTNYMASEALLLPKYTMPLIGVKTVRAFEEIANNIYIPFNISDRWHPEYDSYEYGTTVKQADVILMGFPLSLGMASDVRGNDLHVYQEVTTLDGPAMTWGMFAIGWMELNETDKAMESFEKQFLNVVPPFNMWSERPGGQGAMNFITGMGGYLQSIIFGFGGFRMYTDRLDFNPTMPQGVDKINITGLDYLGGSFDFSFSDSLIVVNQTQGNRKMMISLTLIAANETLTVGKPYQFIKQKASLSPLNDY